MANVESDLERYWRNQSGNKPEDRGRLVCSASDFVQTLEVLLRRTRDSRFRGAYDALLSHGLIDERGRFKKNWESENSVDASCMPIHVDVQQGWTVHRACQELAAFVPIRAASFKAAVKKLENLYRNWLKSGGPERCAAELAFYAQSEVMAETARAGKRVGKRARKKLDRLGEAML